MKWCPPSRLNPTRYSCVHTSVLSLPPLSSGVESGISDSLLANYLRAANWPCSACPELVDCVHTISTTKYYLKFLFHNNLHHVKRLQNYSACEVPVRDKKESHSVFQLIDLELILSIDIKFIPLSSFPESDVIASCFLWGFVLLYFLAICSKLFHHSLKIWS